MMLQFLWKHEFSFSDLPPITFDVLLELMGITKSTAAKYFRYFKSMTKTAMLPTDDFAKYFKLAHNELFFRMCKMVNPNVKQMRSISR